MGECGFKMEGKDLKGVTSLQGSDVAFSSNTQIHMGRDRTFCWGGQWSQKDELGIRNL